MKRIVSWLLYAIVGVLFVYAGMLKAWDPEKFVTSILTYEVMGRSAAIWVALFLPYLEITAGACLIFGLWLKGARAIVIALLVAFMILIAQAYARGLSFDCGCFGSSEVSSDFASAAWAFGRDALMLAGLLAAAKLGKK